MKFSLLLVLFFPFAAYTSDLSNSNILFGYAETEYVELFYPAGRRTFKLDGYLVRYYPDTHNYIGTIKGEVYVYGKIFHGD